MADNQQDDFWDKLREQLKRLVEASSADDPLKELLQAFIGFFVGIDDDQLAYEDENGNDTVSADPTRRAAAERDFQARNARDEQGSGNFRESARTWTTERIGAVNDRLMALRAKYEAANGGKHVDAVMPVSNPRVTSEFGHRHSPTAGASSEHKGLDIAPPTPGQNVPVMSAMPGVVVGVGVRGGYGNMIEVMDIYGNRQRYGHLASINVKVGDEVAPGQAIGVMGSTGRSTGVHLHFEMRDKNNNAFDPMEAIRGTARPVVAAAVAPEAPAASAKPETPIRIETPAKPAAKPPANLPPAAAAAAKEAGGKIASAKPHAVPAAQAKTGFHVSDVVDGVTHGVSTAFNSARTAVGSVLNMLG